jgi:hypothetical protein
VLVATIRAGRQMDISQRAGSFVSGACVDGYGAAAPTARGHARSAMSR